MRIPTIQLNLADVESIMSIVYAFEAIALERDLSTGAAAQNVSVNASTHDDDEIKIAVLWFHHILAISKRKAIIQEANELGVSGLSKPGYPGAVFIEGTRSSVDEWIHEIKSLKWQACQVRLEQQVSGRLLHWRGVRETESMSELSESLPPPYKTLFLEVMKVK